MKNSIKSCILFGTLGLTAASCGPNWGQMDPPAGNQVYPSLQNVACYNFDEEMDPLLVELASLSGGTPAVVAVDDSVQSPVLDISQGTYAKLANALIAVECQKAASVSFWFKQVSGQTLEEGVVAPLNSSSSLLHWDMDGSTLDITANGSLKLKSGEKTVTVDAPGAATESVKADKWQFLTFMVSKDDYKMYVDGEAVPIALPEGTDLTAAVELMNHADFVTLNSDGDQHMLIDDFTFFRNSATEKEAKQPKKGKIGQTGGSGDESSVPKPFYFFNFENGLEGCEIIGGGQIEDAGGERGMVFRNAKGGMRQNYLRMPEDIFVKADKNKEITIGFWVSAANEGASNEYMWSPIFTCYNSANSGPDKADNTWPMLACQYRGVLQQNANGGWCDYVDANNDNGVNGVYHDATDWLADKEWHYYTATFTQTSAAVYFDGEIVNSWTIDGVSEGQICNIFGCADLNYACLGGNQAWNWGDQDPAFMFDDVAFYDVALTQDQIKAAMHPDTINPIFEIDFEKGLGATKIVGDGQIVDSGDGFGKVFQNAKGGMRQNYLLLPEDIFAKTGDNQAITISFWVNAKNAGASNEYMWSPIFSAYNKENSSPGCAENTWPMFICQYRGVVQQNANGGWCDYVDANNDNGVNGVYHDATDWLADKQWHHYSAVFTPTSAAVYFDGEVVNSWTIDGESEGQRCFVFGFEELNYICLGGNQAWNWGDPDPAFMFDEVKIYDQALSQDQIKSLATPKK